MTIIGIAEKDLRGLVANPYTIISFETTRCKESKGEFTTVAVYIFGWNDVNPTTEEITLLGLTGWNTTCQILTVTILVERGEDRVAKLSVKPATITDIRLPDLERLSRLKEDELPLETRGLLPNQSVYFVQVMIEGVIAVGGLLKEIRGRTGSRHGAGGHLKISIVPRQSDPRFGVMTLDLPTLTD